MTAEQAGRERTIYRGEQLRAVAMPLGGLGTGSVALCGDGSVRQWQIFNTANHLAMLPHSFFALWAHEQTLFTAPVVRVLQSAEAYDQTGFMPAPLITDHIVPPACKDLLARLPGVAHTEFIGEYPIAQVNYADDALPVAVSLQAFSPCIPLNEDDSGLPVVLFRFTVTNPGPRAVAVSLAATLQNAVGWDGITPIWGVDNALYGGNCNGLVRLRGLTAIEMNNTTRRPADDGYGQMVLAALSENATYLTQWDDLQGFWDDFAQDGRLADAAPSQPSAAGKTWNGALAASFTLKPGEQRACVFFIAWRFPNRYVDWDQERYNISDTRSRFFLGNRYAERFASALAVAEYVRDHHERLIGETLRFRDTFYDSTLPYMLLDAITAPVSTLRSPTCLWSAEGHFFGFEGCMGASVGIIAFGGCCPMNCTHVWNYEFALARLWPRLERDMREVDLLVQQYEDGGIPYRTVLPLYLPRWRESRYSEGVVAADGQMGTILKTYREYLQSGDGAWLARLWPSVKQAMHYAMATWDADGDGLCDGPQWNTYDCFLYGHNSFISGLYLAALRACEAMARVQGDADMAQACQERFDAGRANLDAQLWNGEYYVQKIDPTVAQQRPYGDGCHADQLVGQWWAHLLGLGYLLPPERVRAALGALFRHNWRADLHGHDQQLRVLLLDEEPGLILCTWPRGGRPGPGRAPVIGMADEIWTGTEYAVGSAMLYEGLLDEATTIVASARARHDGRRRSPWNEIECGDHYVRALSSWALLEAAAGLRYDAARQFLGFAPRLAPDDFRAFFIGAQGWGTLAQQVADGEQRLSVHAAYGEITLRELACKPLVAGAVASVRATLGGQHLAVTRTADADGLTITLPGPVSILPGAPLAVTLAT